MLLVMVLAPVCTKFSNDAVVVVSIRDEVTDELTRFRIPFVDVIEDWKAVS
jgi:hypothetical protein